MKFKNLGLSRQLIILIGFVIVLSVTLNTGLTLYRQQQTLYQTLEERGRVLVNLTSNILFNPLYLLEVSNVDDILGGLVAEEDIVFALVRDVDGKILSVAGEDQTAVDSTLQGLAATASLQQKTVWQSTADQLLLAGPISFGSTHIGSLTIGISLHPLQEELTASIIQSVLFSLLWIGLGLVGVFLIARYITRPLQSLIAAVEAIRRRDFNISLHPTGAHEIKVLGLAFEQMAADLQKVTKDLEQRVADRTRDLEISMDVGRRLSTILDERELVAEVVEQVRAAFDYYYAHIYIFDEAKEKLVMAGGTGEAGQTMLARGHTLDRGQGLVGRAAETNTAVVVPDVSQQEGWLPNPLLPETKAEVAVPIAVGEEVLGVLDVQHNVTGGLSQTQADLIQAIANQVAIALRNARTYAQTQRQAERQVMVNAITQKIQNTNTVDDAMQVAVRELGRALGKGRTRVQLNVARTENGQK